MSGNTPPKQRILAIDTSASPGFAVIEYGGKLKTPKLIYADSLKTDSNTPDSERFAVVEAFTSLITFKYGPFTDVCRESFTKGGSKRSTQLVFGAWAAVDSALGRFGYHIQPSNEFTPSTVKKTVTGKGTADKIEVERGVRDILNVPSNFLFKSDDASDAAAIGIVYLRAQGVIKLE